MECYIIRGLKKKKLIIVLNENIYSLCSRFVFVKFIYRKLFLMFFDFDCKYKYEVKLF